MSSLKAFLLPLALFAAPLAAHAQEWRDDGGNGRYGRYEREQKEVFWDGNCRVVRSVDQDGELQEKRRCRGDRRAYERARSDDDEREPSRYAASREPSGERDYPVRRRYGDDAVQPEMIGYREVPPLPAPPVQVARVLRAPASIAVTVLPRTVAAPVAVATRYTAPIAARPAPAPRAVAVIAPAPRLVAKAAPKLIPAAPAPRQLAKAAPAARVAAKAAPALRVAAKAAPVAAPRLLVKVRPAPTPAPRIAAKAAPVVRAPRLAAKAMPVVKPARILVQQKPVLVAKAAPVLAAKAAPVVAAKAAVLAKSAPADVASRTVVLRIEPVLTAPEPKLAGRIEPAPAVPPTAPTVESGTLTVRNMNVYRNPYSIVPDRKDKYSNLH